MFWVPAFRRMPAYLSQAGFTKLLLQPDESEKDSAQLVPFLRSFMRVCFAFQGELDTTLCPELEDVFTSLDLSANTGHHLGKRYSSHKLRELRRILLSRIVGILHTAYLQGKSSQPDSRLHLLQFLRGISPQKHQFVSLNWDTVLEGCFEEIGRDFSSFYNWEIDPVIIKAGRLEVLKRSPERLQVAKVHGSINWLYCDCCRRTFSVPVEQVVQVPRQVLHENESEKILGSKSAARLKCPRCHVDLGVRLATFSYQKALRTTYFESSWLQAEKTLRRSHRWVFIGYSLPAADFEFKHLLKRIELSRRHKPEIIVVTKVREDSLREGDPTALRFKRFFGSLRPRIFYEGLASDTVEQLLEG